VSEIILAVTDELVDRFRADAHQRELNRVLPYDEMALIAQSGLPGLIVPVDAGGPGTDYPTMLEVVRRLATADPSLAQILMIHYCQLTMALVNPATVRAEGSGGDLARFMAAEALAGRMIASAIAERGTPSALAYRTAITRNEDGRLVLNGSKYYCTGSLFAHWLGVAAVADTGERVKVLVPASAAGVDRVDDWNAFGQRLTGSGTVHFADVIVDESLIFPTMTALAPTDEPAEPDLYSGLYAAACSNYHAAINVGIARNAADDGFAFLRDKTRPWAYAGVAVANQEPHLLRLAGEISTSVTAAEALLAHSGARVQDAITTLTADTALAARLAVAQAKTFGTETALSAATELLTLGGTQATDRSLNLDRHWRNARTHTTQDATRWMMHYAGDAVVNGTAPPNTGRL